MRHYKNIGRRAQGGFAWIPAAISAVAGLAGGALANRGASDRNIAQIAQSQKQMDFQERMSNTAHQRQIKDMRLAGLNPILSATGGSGASSPAGAQAQIADELGPAVTSAMGAIRLTQELKNMKATEMQSLSAATANSARAALSEAQTSAIAPASIVGDALQDAADALSRAGNTSGSLFDAFKSKLSSMLRGGTASAREAARRGPGLRLRNLSVSPPKRIGGK